MSASNRDIVQAVFAASAAEEWDVVRSHLHDDVRIIEADSLPYSGVFEGPDGFIALNRQVFDTWEDSSNTIEHILADGDHVVILTTMSGRGRGSGELLSWQGKGDSTVLLRYQTHARCALWGASLRVLIVFAGGAANRVSLSAHLRQTYRGLQTRGHHRASPPPLATSACGNPPPCIDRERPGLEKI